MVAPSVGEPPASSHSSGQGAQAQDGPHHGAHRLGPVAAGDDEHAGGDGQRWEQVAGPPDGRAEEVVHAPAHPTGGAAVEGEGEQDPHGDQADRPQVGGVVGQEARLGLGGPVARWALAPALGRTGR